MAAGRRWSTEMAPRLLLLPAASLLLLRPVAQNLPVPSCRQADPPPPSPTDALWRPRFHHVGFNDTNRGHMQDPSGVIYDEATRRWHVFPDCWQCVPQPTLTW